MLLPLFPDMSIAQVDQVVDALYALFLQDTV